jgi:hypothetical protein
MGDSLTRCPNFWGHHTKPPGNRDLLGGLDSIARTVADLTHWVVASTAEFPLQAVDELRLGAQEKRVNEVILDWPKIGIPPLAGALTLGRDEVARSFPTLAPILDRLADRPEIIEAGEMVRDALRSEPMGRPIYNPALHYIPGKTSPRATLDARYRVVPLMNRETEMADWLPWARQGNTACRLLTGDGGMGKTRLLIEVCEQLRTEGWRTGFLLEGVDAEALRRQLVGRKPFLIVVDYAERRARDLEVLCEAIRATKGQVRLALLARSDGVWREDLLANSKAAANFLGENAGMNVLQLEPAAPTKAMQSSKVRREMFYDALHAYKPFDGTLLLDNPLPIDFSDPKYDRILLLLLEAWVTAFGNSTDTTRSAIKVVLDKEQGYLKPLAPPGIPPRTMMEVLAWIYAHGAAHTRQQAVTLLTYCPSLAGQTAAIISQLVDIFHDVYPGPHYLNPIQPDLIGHAVMEKFGP